MLNMDRYGTGKYNISKVPVYSKRERKTKKQTKISFCADGANSANNTRILGTRSKN